MVGGWSLRMREILSSFQPKEDGKKSLCARLSRLMSPYLIFPSSSFFTFISSSLHLSSLQLLRFLLPFVPSFSSFSPSLCSSFSAPCVLLGHRSIPCLREYSVQRMLGRRSSIIVWQSLQRTSSARTEAPLKTRV